MKQKEILKINKKELTNKKAQASYIQIIILILSSFAFSYFVAIPFVSAETNVKCCSKLKNGEACKSILSSECPAQCQGNCEATSCENLADCKTGCCFNSNEGSCSINSGKAACELRNGVWNENAACNIKECEKGCCILGDEASFVTEKKCEFLAKSYGLNKEFKTDIRSEVECLGEVEKQVKGACLIGKDEEKFDKNACKILTKKECLQITGSESDFFQDSLCSNSKLNTTCQKQASFNCVEGKDEVYWFDSCGNAENIYSSDKDASWNSGKLLSKEKSCGAGNSNINSGCGNCNYNLGSRCKKQEGKAICKDMNCKDKEDGKKKNGQSWCSYDSCVGEGKDVVGSRHYKKVCIDGEVKVEPCEDYRGEICTISQKKANCVKNDWQSCLSIGGATNEEELSSMTSACEEIPFCQYKHIEVDKGFYFDLCLPKFPPGFDLSQKVLSEDESLDFFGQETKTETSSKITGDTTKEITGEAITSKATSSTATTSTKSSSKTSQGIGAVGESLEDEATSQCSMATQTCTVVFVKEPSAKGTFTWSSKGDYECKVNCKCLEQDFAEQMNEWCYSLGDCGAYANVAGDETSRGASVTIGKTHGLVSSSDLEKLQPEGTGGDCAEEKAESGDIEIDVNEKYNSELAGNQGSGIIFAKQKKSGGSGGSYGYFERWGYWFQYILTDRFVKDFFDFRRGGTLLVIKNIIGGLIDSTFGTHLVMKKGKIKKVKITFECKQWEVPSGGESCDECNKDKTKPCSQYKCSSLGTTCELVNEGTGKELCINVDSGDVSSPKISPWKENITQGYKYDKITSKGFSLTEESGECIQENKAVVFGIKTSEPAICKIDSSHKATFNNMNLNFDNSNIYKFYHQTAINMPSREAILAAVEKEVKDSGGNLTGDEKQEIEGIIARELGNQTLYIRCKDVAGNINEKEFLVNFCLKPGPDLTAPVILTTNPAKNGFLKYNVTKTNLTIWINEPSECKYSKEDKKYENMTGNMSCQTTLLEGENLVNLGLYIYNCSSQLNNLNATENKLYIRCKDQPWLEGKETINKTRNSNQESFIWTIKKTNQLEIQEISPSGKIQTGVEPVTINLEAETTGGAENKVICQYSFNNYNNMITFFNTNSNKHKQILNQMMSGIYTAYVKCEDIAGNVAKKYENFTIEIDKTIPKITRAYNYGGSLIIITDEDAECKYSNDAKKKCNFNYDNSTLMEGIEKTHSTAWNTQFNYYIKCKDKWENKDSGCGIIAKPFDLEQ